MKFQPDSLDGLNAIARIEPGRVWVRQASYEHSVLVPWQGAVQAWNASQPGDLTVSHFAPLVELAPELVIFGSGAKHTFVSPALYRALIEHRIGIETMDTAAACRTYNVLVSEGRKVVAALLI
ncbi:Mth938-like domain-containing protein [Ideonella oryzae]|uniref:Mth938-like domain-containing protein n=1 Tax=Ideonella oryzae TaxID=2937441 RepID=A0ABT1BNU9_9BURK|nr:Mth938-like domain-containing protein [Ideonella oryzae]